MLYRERCSRYGSEDIPRQKQAGECFGQVFEVVGKVVGDDKAMGSCSLTASVIVWDQCYFYGKEVTDGYCL